MKKLIQTIILLGASCAYAQTTNLTFQWHGQTMGVEFAMTNLTDSVKVAIRDDIAYSLSLIATNHVTFEASTPDTNYIAAVRFHYQIPVDYCEGILCLYKTIEGNIWWQIGPNACSEYLAAITLTNQHAAAVNAFSNFYHQVINGFDITGMTLEEKKSFFWGHQIEWAIKREGDNFENVLSEALASRPTPPPGWSPPPRPPILAFLAWEPSEYDDQPVPVLLCKMRRDDGNNTNTVWPFVYAGGKWRWCLWDM